MIFRILYLEVRGRIIVVVAVIAQEIKVDPSYSGTILGQQLKGTRNNTGSQEIIQALKNVSKLPE